MISLGKNVQRAGFHSTGEFPSADGSGGPRLRRALEQRGRGLLYRYRLAVFARPRFYGRGSKPAGRSGGRDHRRCPREKTLAGRATRSGSNSRSRATRRSPKVVERSGFNINDDSSGQIQPEQPLEVIGIVPATRDAIYRERAAGHALSAVRARLPERRQLRDQVRGAQSRE